MKTSLSAFVFKQSPLLVLERIRQKLPPPPQNGRGKHSSPGDHDRKPASQKKLLSKKLDRGKEAGV